MDFLNKTKSLCPICLTKIDANIIEKKDKIIISKKCAKHGKFECFHAWDDPFLYKKFMRLSKKKKEYIKDTTVDLTSKCNMNCPFCFRLKDNFYEPEIPFLIEKAKKWGEGSILLYGGEPTLRNDLSKIIKEIKRNGLKTNLLTNGLNLNKSFVKELEKAGLDKVQLQFDSLDDDINIRMRKRELLKYKLNAIKNLDKTNINLTLFAVLIKDVNESQIDKIISFVGKNSRKITTVIFSPVSPEGDNKNFKAGHIDNDDIFRIIERKFNITKEDFILCTEFDISLSNFLHKLSIERRSPAPCEALCYIFCKSNLVPMNRIIELKKLTEIFDNIIKSKEKNKLKIISSFIFQSIKKKVKIKIVVLPFLFQVLNSTIISFITQKPVKSKFNKSFGLIINPSQNRYNIDYNFINKCNLYSDTKDEKFIPFCERNIIYAGPKTFNNLNSNFFLREINE